MHTKFNWAIAAICVSVPLSGCNTDDESLNHHFDLVQAAPADSAEAAQLVYPLNDVRHHFIGKEKPSLDDNALLRLRAGSQENDKPEILVKELDYPTLEYAPDGTLYFIGDNQDAIVAIDPSGSSKVIVRSGVMGYVTPDGGSQPEPMYNTFEGLILTSRGRLLTMQNGALPYEIDAETGDKTFLAMTSPKGEVFRNELDMINSSDFDPQFTSLRSDGDWIILYSPSEKSWCRYKRNGKIERIEEPLSLNNPDVYLNVTDQYGITGPDGYIYAVEQGKGKQEPDRVIRIGDSGLSSLRKDASRVVIAQFKHGELTGSIAFSPSGALAVGAKNRIYLITPGPAGEPQHGRLP